MGTPLKGSQCLVTGGAGFIGSALVLALLKCGANVVVLDNFATGKSSNRSGHPVKVIEADIRDLDKARSATRGSDYVFHLAAASSVPRSIREPALALSCNVMGTLHLLLASKESGVKKFVNVSSSSVYGGIKDEYKKETMPVDPLSPYAVSKYSAELIARNYVSTYGLDTVNVRYFNVFGPRQNPDSPYAAVIPRFIRALLSGEPPVIYGDGTQARDFTFVEDAVEATILALLHGKAGEAYNVGAGRLTSLKELLEILYSITGRSIAPIFQERRLGDVYRSGADISKARIELGYQPKIDLTCGLEKTVAWFKEEAPCR